MNPSLKLLLILIISVEISFTSSLSANLILILISVLYLIIRRVKVKTMALLALVPLLPAIGIFVTIYYFSPAHDLHFAWVLFTRMYVYVSLGATFTLTTQPMELALSLEQNWHLPAKFAYGTLAAFNVLPKIKNAVITIQKAALMRGVRLGFWSPQLYFKAVLVALHWSDNLAQAMISHGFVEDAPRTFYRKVPLTPRDVMLLIIPTLIVQIPIFLLN